MNPISQVPAFLYIHESISDLWRDNGRILDMWSLILLFMKKFDTKMITINQFNRNITTALMYHNSCCPLSHFLRQRNLAPFFLLVHNFHCMNEVQNETIFEDFWVMCMITENWVFPLIHSKAGLKFDLIDSNVCPEPWYRHVFHTGGQIAGSLAVITDAAHILVDLTSILISLFSLWLTSKSPKQLTFGWHQAGSKHVTVWTYGKGKGSHHS